jgi:hypothetical protein
MTVVGSLQGDWRLESGNCKMSFPEVGGCIGRRYTYVHNTTIDVSKLLQSEQPCAMSGVIEYEALQILLASFQSNEMQWTHGRTVVA